MATATVKKTCVRCNKGAGTAMCHGCEQSFCTKHFIEHRQELSQQMDNIGQEHDILRKDLTQEQGTHPLLARINQWQQESIIKIKVAAESARTDLHRLLNKAKNDLKTSVNKMSEELQSSRDSDDYTELDIKKWTNQLQELRDMLDSPTTINIDYENDTRSAIRLIKVSSQESSDSTHKASQLHKLNKPILHNLETSDSERFVDIVGGIRLSEGDLLATYSDYSEHASCVDGIGRYSLGVHCIRFGIEQVSRGYYILFGIMNSSEKMKKNMQSSTSLNGWWDLHYSVISGKQAYDNSSRTIQTGDEVTLMLDCDKRRIQLEHHRTHQSVDMSINPRLCAFPWKIVVLIRGKNDCVRILH